MRISQAHPAASARALCLAVALGCGLVDWSAAQPAEAQACVAPITYIPLDARQVGQGDDRVAALGSYERVSPDGRFVLRSYSGALLGKVTLMELPVEGSAGVRVFRTPFSNEAFPVQGTWRYLVDVTGEHYRFADVLARQRDAKPLFRAGMTGFYAAASELGVTAQDPYPKRDTVYIRSLSWPQDANADNSGVGPLQVATVQVRDDGPTAKAQAQRGAQFICGARATIDGNVYALPMLSVDGTEFSAIPQTPRAGAPSMRIYGLSSGTDGGSAHPCDLRADLGASPAKAVFGYPPGGGGSAWLTFSDLGHVYVFSRALNQVFRLDHGKYRVLASAFPGLTRDGRVIYAATWRDCAETAVCAEQAGYVVVDPLQSAAYRAYWQQRGAPAPQPCITKQQVRDERAAFARFHGLASAGP